MSRFPRFRRRPDHWSDPHQRARARLAERLDGPLGLAETTWLDEHLAACPACTAVAAGYDADRAALRALRAQPPEPPRDLWARTAAAIEAAEAGGATGREVRERDVRRSLPLGALSGLAVVVIMVGVGLVSANLPLGGATGGAPSDGPEILGGGSPSAPAGSPALAPGATPIAVDPFAVGWVERGPDGVAGHQVSVDEVCPVDHDADCPAVNATRRLSLDLAVTPRTIVASPSRKQAVAISEAADATDQVVVVALPEAGDPEPTARVSASATPTSAPSASAASPSPTTDATTEPSPSLVPASIEPSSTPAPTAAQRLAIASGIRVVGQSAAFSPDGAWFAFTARPADGSDRTDVYVWRVGDSEARPLTDDGISYFASWSDGALIASRPDDPGSEESDASSLRIDPETGEERTLGPGWRPAVDPSRGLAIVWLGTVTRREDGTWVPAEGRLELRGWSDDGPAGADGADRDRLASEKAPRDFDVRWDDTGEWVGVWVADRDDPVVGRLSLYHVDAERGRLERVDGAPADVAALPGFSIGDGRLAWATPRGQGGEGSRIQIAAWSETDVGLVESSPGEDPVVIR